MLSARLEIRRGQFRLSLSLEVPPGPTAIIGPNGAGKTTALLAILGALPDVEGKLTVDGATLLDSSQGLEVPVEDRRIAYVPQDYGLFPHLSVLDNVTFGLRTLAPDDRGERVAGALERLDVQHLQDRLPGSLSGGERQRVALARAVAMRPRAVLLDEPLAALDKPTRLRMRGFLAEHLRSLAVPALVVTHDAADVVALGGPLAVLESGRVAQTGPLGTVHEAPATDFGQAFWR
jgi:molybdate transport system ATP-binding protein